MNVWNWNSGLEAVTERQILVIGHIQEPLLDLHPLYFAVLARKFDPTVFAVLLLLFFGGGCGGASITFLVLPDEVLADDEDEDGLAAVGGLHNSR